MTRLVVFTTHPIQYQAPWFRALSRVRGLDVEVVFSYLPDASEQGVGFGEKFVWNIPLLEGYRHRTLATKMLPEIVPAFARRWARGVAETLDDVRPDAAMILGWQELSLVQALLACKHRGVPIILRGESNALRRRPLPIAWLHKSYFGLCDAFLAIGEANARLYRDAGVSAARIRVAGYCVDNERFKAEADALRGRRRSIRDGWSIPREAVCPAFVGKLEPKKHVRAFLEGLRRARADGAAVHGLVVGSGSELGAARQFAEEHRVPVTFAGFVNQGEIARAYVAADAVVMPSDFGETWGLVVNEGMATGLPAIVSDRVGCANDLVIDGQTGFVVPFGDGQALGGAMSRLAFDPELRLRMGRLAQARVQEHFSIEVAVARTLEMIDMVGRRGQA